MAAIIVILANKPTNVETITQYEPVYVEVVREIPQEPTYAYNISFTDREMLARLVYLEANTESIECQKAIVSVVINRWQNGTWGDTLEKVVYYPNQFSPSGLIYKTTPTETNYRAVDEVIKYGTCLPSYIYYFRANFGFSKTWDGYKEYKQIDNVFFGYFEKDKK
jgi:N-acetylmuramoyl-L-alanine amidase